MIIIIIQLAQDMLYYTSKQLNLLRNEPQTWYTAILRALEKLCGYSLGTHDSISQFSEGWHKSNCKRCTIALLVIRNENGAKKCSKRTKREKSLFTSAYKTVTAWRDIKRDIIIAKKSRYLPFIHRSGW